MLYSCLLFPLSGYCTDFCGLDNCPWMVRYRLYRLYEVVNGVKLLTSHKTIHWLVDRKTSLPVTNIHHFCCCIYIKPLSVFLCGPTAQWQSDWWWNALPNTSDHKIAYWTAPTCAVSLNGNKALETGIYPTLFTLNCSSIVEQFELLNRSSSCSGAHCVLFLFINSFSMPSCRWPYVCPAVQLVESQCFCFFVQN